MKTVHAVVKSGGKVVDEFDFPECETFAELQATYSEADIVGLVNAQAQTNEKNRRRTASQPDAPSKALEPIVLKLITERGQWAKVASGELAIEKLLADTRAEVKAQRAATSTPSTSAPATAPA